MPHPVESTAPPRPVPPVVAVALDAVLVVVFAVLGARTHHDGALTPGAVADVAWPFLAGLAVAYALLVGLGRVGEGRAGVGRNPAGLVPGVGVWLTVLVVGMVLRRLTGDGTALAFVLVATGFTLATLLGWRLLALAVRRG